MEPNELEYIANILKGTVETTVNGKINRLSEKLDTYIKEDMAWKEEKVEPLIDAHKTIKNLAVFLKWLAGGIVALGIIIKAWMLGLLNL